MLTPSRPAASVTSWVLACLLVSACGLLSACGGEDPGKVALRARLAQDARLSSEELGRLRDEIGRTMAGKTVRIKEGAAVRELTDEERSVIFGMLTEPAGMYDEGVRREGPATSRVLNAPGRSLNSEIEASRRLSVDVQTLLPRRFQFVNAFPGYGDYTFDLVVDP